MFIQAKNVKLELMSIRPKKRTSQWREYRSCQQWNIKLHSDKQASKIKNQNWSSESAIYEDQELVQLRSLFEENELDVLAVSESWLNSSVKNAEVEIQGYKKSRLDRQNKIGGGVCIYKRASFKTKVLKDLQVQHMEIFVLGDLNCDLLKSCCEGNTLKDLCDTLNLNQLETSPTRVTPQSPFLIDVILATIIKHQCCQGN